MRITLATNWWALIIRGLAGIAMGILTLAWPGITLVALVFLFAGYALVDGVTSIIAAVHAAEARERWVSMVLEGLVGIAAAIVTAVWPAITALALVYVIAAWAVHHRRTRSCGGGPPATPISGEWLLILSGVASLLFGFLLTMAPLAGAVVIALWVGAYALIFGVLLVALGFRLRMWGRRLSAGGPLAAPAIDRGAYRFRHGTDRINAVTGQIRANDREREEIRLWQP